MRPNMRQHNHRQPWSLDDSIFRLLAHPSEKICLHGIFSLSDIMVCISNSDPPVLITLNTGRFKLRSNVEHQIESPFSLRRVRLFFPSQLDTVINIPHIRLYQFFIYYLATLFVCSMKSALRFTKTTGNQSPKIHPISRFS